MGLFTLKSASLTHLKQYAPLQIKVSNCRDDVKLLDVKFFTAWACPVLMLWEINLCSSHVTQSSN